MESTISTAPTVAHGHDDANKRRLFLVCLCAIVTTSMSFSLRANIAPDLKTALFDPISAAHSGEMLGSALGAVFLTFALTLAFGSPLIDAVGMRTVLLLCAGSFITGSTLTIAADKIASGEGVYTMVWIGMLFLGVGWGCSEAVINPLTTTLYPDDKTHKLNVLHAWWPGGIIIGGLAGWALGKANLSWRLEFALQMLPALALLVMQIGAKFPKTERAAAGIPASDMFKECIRPGFLLWFFAMFLTSAAELAPGQWINVALTHTVGMEGILLLVYVSGLMFVMRHFAGTMVHKLSSVGLLWVSCLLASLGLVAMSFANSPVMGLLAATVWGTGVCYMWPTMLATASERYPKGGAFAMGLIGTAGSLSIFFLLPRMGEVFDHKKFELAGGADKFNALAQATQTTIEAQAAVTSFRLVAALPAVLLLVFGLVWLNDRRKGGFKPVKI